MFFRALTALVCGDNSFTKRSRRGCSTRSLGQRGRTTASDPGVIKRFLSRNRSIQPRYYILRIVGLCRIIAYDCENCPWSCLCHTFFQFTSRLSIRCKNPPQIASADHYYLFILAHDTANWSRIINLARREEKNLKIVNRRGKFFFELLSFRSIEQMIEEKRKKKNRKITEESFGSFFERDAYIYIYI